MNFSIKNNLIAYDSYIFGKASIRPGYIIMRDADELQNDFYNNGYNVPQDMTFHDALIADFFAFYNPRLKNEIRRWGDPPSDFERTGIIYLALRATCSMLHTVN